jgi:hypothetical protein
MNCVLLVVSAFSDLLVCCLIFQVIYDAEINTLVQKGGHPRDLHDTVSSGDSQSHSASSSSDSSKELD